MCVGVCGGAHEGGGGGGGRESENKRPRVMRACLYVHESALKFMRGGSHSHLATASQSFHSLQPRA